MNANDHGHDNDNDNDHDQVISMYNQIVICLCKKNLVSLFVMKEANFLIFKTFMKIVILFK